MRSKIHLLILLLSVNENKWHQMVRWLINTLIGKVVVSKYRGLHWSWILSRNLTVWPEKAQEIFRTVDFRTEIWTGELPNMKQDGPLRFSRFLQLNHFLVSGLAGPMSIFFCLMTPTESWYSPRRFVRSRIHTCTTRTLWYSHHIDIVTEIT
jgi:hypothetical protein